MGNANIPTSSPCSTSDDESPVSIIFLSVVVLSQVSHVPRLQHCKLIKNTQLLSLQTNIGAKRPLFCIFLCFCM